MRIYLTSVSSGEFEGSVSDDELPEKYEKLLEINPEREWCDEVEVMGEFSVEREDGVPFIKVESLILFHNGQEVEFDVNDMHVGHLIELEMSIHDRTDLEDWFTEDYENDD